MSAAFYRSLWSRGDRTGSVVGTGGALVVLAALPALAALVRKAERSSQCRFNPCTNSSVCTMVSEICFNMFELAWTWLLRLLVMLARLLSDFVRLSATAMRLVSASPTVLWVVSRVASSFWRVLVGMIHSPSEPLGSRRLAVMTERLETVGRASIATTLRFEVKLALLDRTAL